MTQPEKRNKVIINLAQAYESKMTSITDRVEAILLPEAHELPKELQEVLDSWGKTPIEEPEFYEMITNQKTTFEQAKEMAVKDIDIDAFDAIEIGTLASRVQQKIVNKIDEDGKYKTTPMISEIKLPRTTQLKELKKMASEKATDDQINKKIFEIAGVEESELSKWESELVKEMFVGYSNAVDKDTVGAYSDRTPFARYLKN